MNCSDSQRAWICRDCGSFLSTQVAVSANPSSSLPSANKRSSDATATANQAAAAAAAAASLASSQQADPQNQSSNYKQSYKTSTISALGGINGIVRCRRCAREAFFDDSRAEIWEDGAGHRFVGGDNVTVVAVPGVLRYLDTELAAMGIRMRFWVDH